MEKSAAPYRYEPTEHFRERLSRIRRTDPAGHRRILAVIDRLLENPGDSDGRMHGAHRDKLKKYVGRREYRLLYYYCELCRGVNRHLTETCRSCSVLPDNSVVFFDVFHKNEKERRHY